MISRRCFGWILLFLCCVRPVPAQQNTAGDLASLVAAQQSHPDSTRAKQDVENTVSDGLPENLPSDLLPALPVDLTSIPDDLGTLVVPKPYLVSHATEPQHGLAFAKVTYLYTPARAGVLHQFCQVHYTVPDDAPLAARMARLLALAHQTLLHKTGREAVGGDAPFQVWLCRTGEAGGEQWARNLYFYDLDASRSSIEWIREIVHEYSHLALPAIGGYKEPEYWANGYLGERLLIRWLQRTPDGPAMVERAWGDFSGAQNYSCLLIAPALALYRRVGPSPTYLSRTDADGMRYLIGQALCIDDQYGSRTLGSALAALPQRREARAADWGAALASVLPHRVLVRRP